MQQLMPSVGHTNFLSCHMTYLDIVTYVSCHMTYLSSHRDLHFVKLAAREIERGCGCYLNTNSQTFHILKK